MGRVENLGMPSALTIELKTLNLVEPFRIAHGVSGTRQLLRLSLDGHTVEAPFVPYYPEDPQAVVAWLRAQEQPWLQPPVNGPRTAMLALELLRLELACHREHRSLGAPAEERLGAPAEGTPPGCRSFSIPIDLAEFAGKIRTVNRQFRVLKLKLGSGNLDLDEATVATAREAAPQATLLADVNGGWSVDEAARMIPRLARWRLALIEQPVHHQHGPAAWRELNARLPSGSAPLVADESAQGVADVAALVGLVGGVNVKLLKCGGFLPACDMIRACRERSLPVLLGCMIESSLGLTAAAHLAPWATWIDLDGHFFVANDDYAGLTYDAAGVLAMPGGYGIGALPKQPRTQ